jgi:sec-independent protein translocase protein TatA
MTTLLFVGGLGPPELLLIAGVLILLFGASKLPKLARSMGTATGEFKKGREEVEGELEEIRETGTEAVSETTGDSIDEAGTNTDAEPVSDAGVESESETEGDQDIERSGA